MKKQQINKMAASNNIKKGFIFSILVFSVLFLTIVSATVSLQTSEDRYELTDANDVLFVGPNGVLLNDDASFVEVFVDDMKTFKGLISKFNQDGSFEYYTDDVNFHGVDYFDYIASDGIVNSSKTRVWIGIENSNPVVASDKYDLTDANDVLFIGPNGILLNDVGDSDGDKTFLMVASEPTDGLISEFNQDGSFEYYTNELDFTGVDYFRYVLSDGYSNSSAAMVVIGVNNSAPVAYDYSYAIDDKVDSFVVVTDVDNDDLYGYVTEDVKFGELLTYDFMLNGTFNYTASKLNGVDYFRYYATDLHKDSNVATIVFVIGNNTAPTAVAESYYYDLVNDSFVVEATNGILINDLDAEGDVLFVESVNDSDLNGSLRVWADGSFEYVPVEGFSGIDTFNYTVTDLDLNSTVEVKLYVNYSGVANITSDLKENMTDDIDVEANLSSEIYPLILIFELSSNGSIVDEETNTAANESELPTVYDLPANLANGNYSLQLSVYDVSGNLIERTDLGDFFVDTSSSSGSSSGDYSSSSSNSASSVGKTVCTEWTVCTDSEQSRVCENDNTEYTVSRDCIVDESPDSEPISFGDEEDEEPGFFSAVTGAVTGALGTAGSIGALVLILLIAGALVFVVMKRKILVKKK